MFLQLVVIIAVCVSFLDVVPVFAQSGLDGTQVVRIFVRTHTANEQNADTPADIYLGFAGRELFLDKDEQRGDNAVDLYRFGPNDFGNVTNRADNNPTVGPRIVRQDVLAHEVYLRMPDTEGNHWVVQHVDVTFAAFQSQELARYCFFGRAILGPQTGFKLPLTRHTSGGACPGA